MTPTGEISIRASRSARGAAHVAVGAGVGDRGGRLRGEQHEHLLVLVGELRSGLLLAEEEIADLRAAVAHRRTLEGVDDHPVGVEAEPGDIGAHVRHPYRRGHVAQCLEDPQVVRPRHDLAFLLGREAAEYGVLELPGAVDGGDDGEAGAGQRAGGLGDFAKHGIELEARADAQDGRGERGDPLAGRLEFAAHVVGIVHRSSSPSVLSARQGRVRVVWGRSRRLIRTPRSRLPSKVSQSHIISMKYLHARTYKSRKIVRVSTIRMNHRRLESGATRIGGDLSWQTIIRGRISRPSSMQPKSFRGVSGFWKAGHDFSSSGAGS